MTTEKYDVKTAHKALYAPSAQDFTVVDVPRMQYLAIDGHGNPNTSPEYAAALEALYPVAYSVKFTSKKQLGRDFVVGPLEGLWRADDMMAFTTGDKDAWDWTLLINQPDWITTDLVTDAVTTVTTTKGVAAAQRVRLFTLDEGTCVQILHIGAYDDEAPTLDRLHHEYLPAHGLTFAGDHHEIYLSDPRRTEPSKLRTVLRQPVRSH
ncbi:hypothetical protein IWX78_000629 [Mycetocola sp. CAN_C7]|uniref:GyrI-like domain-containing protein n=1 Tax=Mycetocola sp. CAN_C7 TaxID=2787724 RepID=UPI0018C962D8